MYELCWGNLSSCTNMYHRFPRGEGLFDQLVNQDIVSFIIFNNTCINHSEKLVGWAPPFLLLYVGSYITILVANVIELCSFRQVQIMDISEVQAMAEIDVRLSIYIRSEPLIRHFNSKSKWTTFVKWKMRLVSLFIHPWSSVERIAHALLLAWTRVEMERNLSIARLGVLLKVDCKSTEK